MNADTNLTPKRDDPEVSLLNISIQTHLKKVYSPLKHVKLPSTTTIYSGITQVGDEIMFLLATQNGFLFAIHDDGLISCSKVNFIRLPLPAGFYMLMMPCLIQRVDGD